MEDVKCCLNHISQHWVDISPVGLRVPSSLKTKYYIFSCFIKRTNDRFETAMIKYLTRKNYNKLTKLHGWIRTFQLILKLSKTTLSDNYLKDIS